MLEFTDTGKSHDKEILVIFDNLTSNVNININYIKKEYRRGKMNYGMRKKMLIEKSRVDILSGGRGERITGDSLESKNTPTILTWQV